MIPTSTPTAGAGIDRLQALAQRVNAIIEWKIDQERRSEARFHQRRRQARRRRQRRIDRRRVLLSSLVRRVR